MLIMLIMLSLCLCVSVAIHSVFSDHSVASGYRMGW
jgi:hypothetical protein